MRKKEEKMIILDYGKLKRIVEAHKALGHKIVCTIGSWDMLHIGHLRYLMKAKSYGDILVVGADSDRGIKLYKKNNLRPVIPQKERLEMLKYQQCIDYATLVDDIDKKGNWQYGLVKTIRPDFFVTTDSYTKEQIKKLRLYAGKVLKLTRQAGQTSTTEFIEKTVKKHLKFLASTMTAKK